MPAMITKDCKLIDVLKILEKEYQIALEMSKTTRDEINNPQCIHKLFKENILNAVRKRSKELKPEILKTINALKVNRSKSLNNADLDKDSRRENAAILDEKIKDLEMLRFAQARDTVATNIYLMSETIMKPWINLNKEQKIRDVIVTLKDSNLEVTRLEQKSAKMAEVAKKHHEDL